MKVLNFTDEEQWNIWRIVALVMHLGNLVFAGEAVGKDRCGLSRCRELSRSTSPMTLLHVVCSNLTEEVDTAATRG